MLKIKIVHLPNGRWCLEMPDGTQSPCVAYEERIIWNYDPGFGYAGQTAYWGEEMVWILGRIIPHESIDRTV